MFERFKRVSVQCVEAWIKFMIRKGIQNETVKEKQFENNNQDKKITSEKKEQQSFESDFSILCNDYRN